MKRRFSWKPVAVLLLFMSLLMMGMCIEESIDDCHNEVVRLHDNNYKYKNF